MAKKKKGAKTGKRTQAQKILDAPYWQKLAKKTGIK